MAYTDMEKRPFNAFSAAGTVAINGGVLLGLLFAAPQMLPDLEFVDTNIFWLEPEAPKPLPVEQQEVKKQPDTKIVTPPAQGEKGATGTNLFAADDEIVQPSETLKSTQITEVIEPEAKLPVFVTAQLDMRRTKHLQPDYPPSMIRAEMEGVVTVRILVGVNGKVTQVEQVRATDPAFFLATKAQALESWKFKPATKDGIAVESWREMTVRFKLPE